MSFQPFVPPPPASTYTHPAHLCQAQDPEDDTHCPNEVQWAGSPVCRLHYYILAATHRGKRVRPLWQRPGTWAPWIVLLTWFVWLLSAGGLGMVFFWCVIVPVGVLGWANGLGKKGPRR